MRHTIQQKGSRMWYSIVMAGIIEAVCLPAALADQDDHAYAGKQPNIILFFVDDLGWADLGYRNPVFESPNIDRLAREGIDFEQAYTVSPTCSPSRAALLTGQYPTRFQVVRHVPSGHRKLGFDKFGRTDREFNYWPNNPVQIPSRNWLPLDSTTYAESLKNQGYYSMFVGKWHLGDEAYYPVKQGFDQETGVSNFGLPDSYYPPYLKNATIFAEEKERYLTDKLTDEAVKFIETYDREKPFMLTFWHYSVHAPHEGRKDLVSHFEAKGLTGEFAHYAAMVKAMDESVGRVREAIEKKGLAEDTIVVLLSDQGGYFDNAPFYGSKRCDALYEGGTRIPFIFYWPGNSKAGKNNSIVQSIDLFPTLIEIAGGNVAGFKDLDGISLVSAIRENSMLERSEPIYVYHAYVDLYASVRLGDWKLIAYR
ncbi:MAG: sulfatase, partial [Verrucomicrobiota bacterium]|nr:sulfatase [Verrucomicrobiota bacterium]